MSATRRQPSRHRRGLVVLATAGLLVSSAACGARWDEAQRESVLAGNSTQQFAAGPQEGSGAGPSTGSSGGRSTGRTGTTTGAAPGGGGDTGTPGADPVAGAPGGDGGGPEASGDKPCAAPSDAPGVTDSQITLGTISTLSGAVPGLGASSEGAARAYIAYRNATGGVCGRELVLKTADDGMDNGRHRSILTEMNEQVLGIVGGIGGGDAGSAEVVDQLGVPVVAVAISKPFDDAANTFNVNPYFGDPNQALPKYRWLYEQGVRKAAIVYTAVDQTSATSPR